MEAIAVPLDGHRVDLTARRYFQDDVISFPELKIVALPSTIHENANIRFRYQLRDRFATLRSVQLSHAHVLQHRRLAAVGGGLFQRRHHCVLQLLAGMPRVSRVTLTRNR